ncbi:LexA family transcriptional regulator [Salmonella enterica]|uniref:LexA family transcriptional regulator n=2 Tax=Salmonella enterica TaxID=28901 RepID=A0A402XAZ9_SALER|nr:LexA family transcriptional regulator [Salmonella enterica]EBP4001061.1 LexA family transcriptional regulator [Salmonella enterica subsp. enterica]EBA9123845.1 LexA family transcriptional regulator [Salmonella enterica]EBQ2950029.1 LexA family transcriptional regulator [Salmonella enterica]EFP2813999.1 LexA family transcriptional regulator [Salmonella enterica]
MNTQLMGERIRARRKELKIRQAALGKMVGVSNVAISQWERSETEPNGENLLALSKALQCSPDYLLKGDLSQTNVAYHSRHEPRGSYPLISWVSAGQWMEAVEPYHKRAIDNWHDTTVDCSEDSFWLDVQGDSMTAPAGLSIPEGMIILVDPEVEPRNGKLVVAKLEGENEATFKKLVMDAGRKFLKPLNPQYPMIEINGNCKIIGVVVDAKLANLP